MTTKASKALLWVQDLDGALRSIDIASEVCGTAHMISDISVAMLYFHIPRQNAELGCSNASSVTK